MPPTAMTTVPPASPSFGERCQEWQKKGAAHDRDMQRKVTVIAQPGVAQRKVVRQINGESRAPIRPAP